MKVTRKIGFMIISLFITVIAGAQVVPYGINYQAVARDATGKELTSSNVDIRFSIISGTPLGNLDYQEIHSDVATSRYGVFTATIGGGTPVAGEYELFSDIAWEENNHYLKVEIKFSSEFVEMGTMQFMSVPYALYAGRSLEPGPVGPQGPQGDPASDNQRLNFDGVNLWIDDGEANPTIISTINLAALLDVDDADADPVNEIQDLRLLNNKLKITNNADATEIDLSHLLTDSDTDATNEIQDLSLEGNILKITKNGIATSIDLSPYLDNTDNQQLSYNTDNNSLSISEGNTVSLGPLVAFRALMNTAIALSNNVGYTLIFDDIKYNDGGNYSLSSGIFTAGFKGNYTFNVSLQLPAGSSSVIIKVDGAEYETLIGPTPAAGTFRASTTMRLLGNEEVSVIVKQSNGYTIDPFSISGSFSGFRVF